MSMSEQELKDLREAHEAEQVRERERKDAERFEADLKHKFMSVPGTTEADWTRNRQQVLDEARRKAALADDVAARAAMAARYQ